MTRRLTFIALMLLAGLLAAACAPATPEGPVGDATKGKAVFDGTCTSCHGPDAKGMPGLGKDLTISEFVKDNNNAEMVAFLLVGRAATDPANTVGVDMPPKGGNPALTEQDLADVVAYMRSLQK